MLNFWHLDVTPDSFYGPNPGTMGWQWMVVSKVGPVLVLTLSVLVRDIVPVYKQAKVFWKELRNMNRKMEMFG